MGKKSLRKWPSTASCSSRAPGEKGHDPDLAVKLFDLMEKFAGYGFNKSHSAAYALISYQTAWLKAYHPTEFLAATMSSGHGRHRQGADLLPRRSRTTASRCCRRT